MSLTISALITNYNTWSLTNRCIQELNKWSYNKLAEILVVDDASQEARPDNLPENTQVVENLKNCGYVASVNIGFAHLQQDIIILLDSDAYPLMDLVNPLIEKFSANPILGAVGFKLVDAQGHSTGAESPEPTTMGLLLGQRFEAQYQKWFKVNKNQLSCIHSCAIAVRRTAFKDICGFDEAFDFTDADIDFSIRLRNAGWDIQIDPSLVLFHKGGGSFQKTSTRVLRHHKNRYRLLRKHGLIRNSWFLKSGLAMRHLVEYSVLKMLGTRLISEPITLQDKLHSRQRLLHNVWNAYGNESR